jgi:hypothetical protein
MCARIFEAGPCRNPLPITMTTQTYQAGARMRQILIAVALVALAGSVSAQETKPARSGYVADARTGCQVWNPYPQPNESVQWDGPCVNGYAAGDARLTWVHPRGRDQYQGAMVGGKMHGSGTYLSFTGDRYEGEWQDGKNAGRGIYSWANGDRYVGEWMDGKQHGRGSLIRSNGAKYEGDWQNGKRVGRGTQIYSNGSRYEGEWQTDRAHGPGLYTFSDGKPLSGDWVNGCLRQGDVWATVGTTSKQCGFE